MLGSSLESRDQYSLFIFNHTVNQGSINYQCKVKKKKIARLFMNSAASVSPTLPLMAALFLCALKLKTIAWLTLQIILGILRPGWKFQSHSIQS